MSIVLYCWQALRGRPNFEFGCAVLDIAPSEKNTKNYVSVHSIIAAGYFEAAKGEHLDNTNGREVERVSCNFASMGRV